jgi:hypothetical protein
MTLDQLIHRVGMSSWEACDKSLQMTWAVHRDTMNTVTKQRLHGMAAIGKGQAIGIPRTPAVYRLIRVQIGPNSGHGSSYDVVILSIHSHLDALG